MKIASEAASEALLTDFSAFREVALFIISIYRRAGTYPHVFNCESPFVCKNRIYEADERLVRNDSDFIFNSSIVGVLRIGISMKSDIFLLVRLQDNSSWCGRKGSDARSASPLEGNRR